MVAKQRLVGSSSTVPGGRKRRKELQEAVALSTMKKSRIQMAAVAGYGSAQGRRNAERRRTRPLALMIGKMRCRRR
jgi:hypothetical protein